jgi:hypothetical protein
VAIIVVAEGGRDREMKASVLIVTSVSASRSERRCNKHLFGQARVAMDTLDRA